MELFFNDSSAISLIKVTSEMLFSADTNYNEKTKMLIVSFRLENNERVNLKFWENIDGYPVLILNMPETFPGGKAEKFYLWLTLFLQWNYKKKMPVPKKRDFRGHSFYDWQPNVFYPINVYLWNEAGIKEYMLNKLVLGS